MVASIDKIGFDSGKTKKIMDSINSILGQSYYSEYFNGIIHDWLKY